MLKYLIPVNGLFLSGVEGLADMERFSGAGGPEFMMGSSPGPLAVQGRFPVQVLFAPEL